MSVGFSIDLSQLPPIAAYIDARKIESAVYNLLLNACSPVLGNCIKVKHSVSAGRRT
ncbi:MAG: hypothetical protein JWQ49_1247 [Edaphobacter sp.]|nr:hypothetical protein [Edaphobacter sp.]